MAKKKYSRRPKSKASSKKQYSASEKRSYKKGFLAGLFASKKKKKVKKNVKSKSGYRSVAEIPKHFQHNVLFSDDRYLNIYRHYSREMGMEHEKARDYALHMYKSEFGDKALRDHYDL